MGHYVLMHVIGLACIVSVSCMTYGCYECSSNGSQGPCSDDGFDRWENRRSGCDFCTVRTTYDYSDQSTSISRGCEHGNSCQGYSNYWSNKTCCEGSYCNYPYNFVMHGYISKTNASWVNDPWVTTEVAGDFSCYESVEFCYSDKFDPSSRSVSVRSGCSYCKTETVVGYGRNITRRSCERYWCDQSETVECCRGSLCNGYTVSLSAAPGQPKASAVTSPSSSATRTRLMPAAGLGLIGAVILMMASFG